MAAINGQLAKPAIESRKQPGWRGMQSAIMAVAYRRNQCVKAAVCNPQCETGLRNAMAVEASRNRQSLSSTVEAFFWLINGRKQQAGREGRR